MPPTIPDPPTELEKTDDKAVKCAKEELLDPVSDEEPMETQSTNPVQSVGVVKLLQATYSILGTPPETPTSQSGGT